MFLNSIILIQKNHVRLFVIHVDLIIGIVVVDFFFPSDETDQWQEKEARQGQKAGD